MQKKNTIHQSEETGPHHMQCAQHRCSVYIWMDYMYKLLYQFCVSLFFIDLSAAVPP